MTTKILGLSCALPILLAVACGGGTPEPVTPANPPTTGATPPSTGTETPAATGAPGATPAATSPTTATTAGGGGPADQIAAGKKLYTDKCASCHGADGKGDKSDPPVVGTGALPVAPPPKAKLRKGPFNNVQDVAAFVKKSMPMDNPGTLKDEDVYAILAFNLDANGIKVDKKVDAASASTLKFQK
jgi:cytochrome c